MANGRQWMIQNIVARLMTGVLLAGIGSAVQGQPLGFERLETSTSSGDDSDFAGGA